MSVSYRSAGTADKGQGKLKYGSEPELLSVLSARSAKAFVLASSEASSNVWGICAVAWLLRSASGMRHLSKAARNEIGRHGGARSGP